MVYQIILFCVVTFNIKCIRMHVRMHVCTYPVDHIVPPGGAKILLSLPRPQVILYSQRSHRPHLKIYNSILYHLIRCYIIQKNAMKCIII